jgi:putative aminopeptidase FrvX
MQRLPIDTDYLQRCLIRLLAIPSPTGYTDNIVRECCAELKRLDVPFELTRRGAIRAILGGREPRGARAIIAHLDTLGAQVKRIKQNGRLELVPVGTWSARFAEGARCSILSEAGAYRGSATARPCRAGSRRRCAA